MKKIIKLTESDLTRIVKRTIMEMDEDEPIYAQKPFTDEEGNDILIPQIMDMLKPIYEESGTEGVVFFLSDLIDNIEDLGDEAFMGPKNY
jgi:hypothetical protein